MAGSSNHPTEREAEESIMARISHLSNCMATSAAVSMLAVSPLGASPVHAQTTGDNSVNTQVIITAEVPHACEIGDAPDHGDAVRLDFGAQRIDAPRPTEAAIDLPIRCNDPGVEPQVRFSLGSNAEGGGRHLRGPTGDLIAYELRRGTNAGAEVWDDAPHTVRLNGDGAGVIPIAGRVEPLPEAIADGRYSDTIIITIGLDN